MKTSILNWRFSYFLQGLLECDPKWAYRRRIISIIGLILFIWISNLFFGLNNAFDWAEKLQQLIPSFMSFPAWLIALPLVLFLPMGGLGFLVVPIAIFCLVIYSSARYVQEIYQFKTVNEGVSYIFAALYGYKYPSKKIDILVTDEEEKDGNWLAGGIGPGYLDIRPGNAILLERLEHPSRILSTGKHYLKRYEKIREVFDTKDLVAMIPQLEAITRDRVIVKINEFHIWYQISASMKDELSFNKNISTRSQFSVEAIRSLSYNGLISNDGKVSWEELVIGKCVKILMDFISEYTYAELTGIDQNDRLRSIQNIFTTSKVKKAFLEIGTRIIRHDYIELHISEEYEEDPRYKKWEQKWREYTEKTRVEGESRKLAFQEFAIPEIHAEILRGVVHSMEGLDLEDQSDENTYYILKRITDAVDPTWLLNQKG